MDSPASQAMNWNIPRVSDEPLSISLESGYRLFIVGPNGSGKSALIQHLVSGSDGQNIRRISAHRQTWLGPGSFDLTPRRRKQFEEQNTNLEREYEALWQEHNAERKQAAVLFDLVANENARANSITGFVDSKDLKGAANARRRVSVRVQGTE